MLLLIACDKEKLVLNDYSTNTFNEVVIIDSLFRDSMTLSFFNSSGVKYLDFDLINVNTNYDNGNFSIGGQFTFINLLGNQMTSVFQFYYVPPATDNYLPGFRWWTDKIGTTYYSNYNLNDMLWSGDNVQFHISGDYQLDSVTFNPIVNYNCDSLYGTPSLARFYAK